MAGPIDALLQRLGETLQADDAFRAYILVNPFWGNPMDVEMVTLEGCTTFTIPLKSPLSREPDFGEQTYPRLITWRPQAVATLHQSIIAAMQEQTPPAQERAFAIGGWFLSTQEPDVVVRHFQRVMVALLPGQGAYARWGDRRLLEWMWPVLDEEQRSRLMGPIHAWWTLDRVGRLVERRKPEGFPDAMAPLNFQPRDLARRWYRFRHAQLLIRNWLDLCESEDPKYLEHVSALMDDAAALDVTNIQDLSLICAYAAQVHPRIARHPRFQHLIQKAKETNLALHQALETIPDPEGWNTMRHELDHPHLIPAQGVH
jgi:hypothetical protein